MRLLPTRLIYPSYHLLTAIRDDGVFSLHMALRAFWVVSLPRFVCSRGPLSWHWVGKGIARVTLAAYVGEARYRRYPLETSQR